jgi:hypothetical protein
MRRSKCLDFRVSAVAVYAPELDGLRLVDTFNPIVAGYAAQAFLVGFFLRLVDERFLLGKNSVTSRAHETDKDQEICFLKFHLSLELSISISLGRSYRSYL